MILGTAISLILFEVNTKKGISMRAQELYEDNDYMGLGKYLLAKGFTKVGETEVPHRDQGYGHQTRLVTSTYELPADYEVYDKIERYLSGKVKKRLQMYQKPDWKPFELSYRSGKKQPFTIVAKVTTQEDAHAPVDRPSIRIPYLHGPFSVGETAAFSKKPISKSDNLGIIGVPSGSEPVRIQTVNPDGTYQVEKTRFNSAPFTASQNELTDIINFYAGADVNNRSKYPYQKLNSIMDYKDYRLAHDGRGAATLTGVSKGDGKRYMLDTGYVDQIEKAFIDREHNHMKRIPKEEWWSSLSDVEKAAYTS